jgi:hypothetical protein
MNFPDNITYELIEPYLGRIVLGREVNHSLCLCPCATGEAPLFNGCINCPFSKDTTSRNGTCGLYLPNNPNLPALAAEIATKHPELAI